MGFSSDGKLQDLMACSVEIKAPDHGETKGTGVLVSKEGFVATCRHVVEAALPLDCPVAIGTEVGIRLSPRAGRVREWRARVCRLLDGFEDDAVLLQIQGNPVLAPEEIAVLGAAEVSIGNEFFSYGFHPLGAVPATRARGTIEGPVPPPEGQRMWASPVQLESRQLDDGMSGAAVLDSQRNLVVGLVSAIWLPDEKGRNAATAWAVDGEVLGQPPFNLPLRDEALPPQPARQPRPSLANLPCVAVPGLDLHGAPPHAADWVERADLLEALSADLANPAVRIASLVGFGGTGKSSLARQWVERVRRASPSVEGIFWWSFNEQPSLDAFLEAALRFLSGGKIDPVRLPGSAERVQVIAAMLGSGRTLFVLDGLESVQQGTGDVPGSLQSSDLRTLLELMVEWPHRSFCLITSRLSPTDLFLYPAYQQHEVGGLTLAQGRSLLRNLGLQGEDKALDEIVQIWDGHALALDLVGHLVQAQGGDAATVGSLSSLLVQEGRSEPLLRILRYYEGLLSRAERTFLRVLSLFRLPAPPDAFDGVFRSPGLPRSGSGETGRLRPVGFLAPIASLKESDFQCLVEGLSTRHLLERRKDECGVDAYSLHPLVRSHFAADPLKKTDFKELHRLIASYYVSRGQPPSTPPRIEDYFPWIEALHHDVQAGDFDLAMEVFATRLEENRTFTFTRRLGAYETQLSVLREFFPEGDVTRPCLIPPALKPASLLRETAFTLMILGRSQEALGLYEALIDHEVRTKSWGTASLAYQDLCRLQAVSGQLAAAEKHAGKALQLGHRARSGGCVRTALVLRGWIRRLRGNLDQATQDMQAAAADASPQGKALRGLRGALIAEHLRCLGDSSRARQIAKENLVSAEGLHHRYNLSRFHRILGELDGDAGDFASAREHHEAAVRFARSTSDRVTLIEALLSRGEFLVLDGNLDAARLDLDDTLSLSRESGYRLFEVRGHLALDALLRAQNRLHAVRIETQAAEEISLANGYPVDQAGGGAPLTAIAGRQEGVLT